MILKNGTRTNPTSWIEERLPTHRRKHFLWTLSGPILPRPQFLAIWESEEEKLVAVRQTKSKVLALTS